MRLASYAIPSTFECLGQWPSIPGYLNFWRAGHRLKLHEIEVATLKTLKISKEDFIALDIDEQRFSQRDYGRTQEIGAAAAHMGFDGLLVPSARTSAENLVLFPDNHHIDLKLSVIRSIETDWVLWRDRTGQK
jgi:hypothetical protein